MNSRSHVSCYRLAIDVELETCHRAENLGSGALEGRDMNVEPIAVLAGTVLGEQTAQPGMVEFGPTRPDDERHSVLDNDGPVLGGTGEETQSAFRWFMYGYADGIGERA